MTIREDAILHFEQEYKTVVRDAFDWRDFDQFFIYGQYLYYYKPQLWALLADDVPPGEPAKVAAFSEVLSFLGVTFPPRNRDTVRALIRSRPGGLPRHVRSTNYFYKLENVCSTQLTIANMTPALLSKIQTTFSSDYNPLLSNLFESLYEHEGNLYCTDLKKYLYNPTGKLGVFHDTGTEMSFYPFATLTAEQVAFVNDMAIVDSDYGTPANIIYL